MAFLRGSPTVAMSVASNEAHCGRPRSVSRTDSHSSSDSISSQSREMAIHIRRPHCHAPAPPPLPPPPYIEELDQGRDLIYDLVHNENRSNTGLAPIPEYSSLNRGLFTRPVQARRYKHSMEVDEDSVRRLSGSDMTQPAHSVGGAGAQTAKLSRRAPSPSNSNPMLQGELPLAQVSHDRSNRDYDHAMLSKIGKPSSPPRHSRADTSDSPVLAQKLSLQTKDVTAQRPSTSEPTSAVGLIGQWLASPSSTGVSPTAAYAWNDQNGLRSPPTESGPNSLDLDPELFVPNRSTQQLTTNGTGHAYEDTPNRSSRSSYDQAMYTPADSEPAEDSTSMRGLIVDETQPKSRRASGAGMKRKALSPPADRQSDERPRQDLYPLRMRMASRSPASYPSTIGSISSAASIIQPPSYQSSGPMSASSSGPFSTAASITSLSSFDLNSPKPHTHLTSAPPVASPLSTVVSKKNQDKMVPRKLSAQTTALSPQPVATRIGNHYICACCPKKPKKFETEEQLRAHENEKQYSCNFCHNRFKNKNEAERHQNSLHLRRHSWSCAALVNYRAVFSPTGAVDSSSTATDACGYCGEEFANMPAPDWVRRLEHLTDVHKFGECNSAKKFFRADHFRQHLKHSHAGRSGKWTNILEHACVRDEIPPEPPAFAVTTDDHDVVTHARLSTGLLNQVDAVRGSQDDGV